MSGISTVAQRVQFNVHPKFPYRAFNYHGYPFYLASMVRVRKDGGNEEVCVLLPVGGAYYAGGFDESRAVENQWREERKVAPIPETQEMKDALDAALDAYGMAVDSVVEASIRELFARHRTSVAAKAMREALEEQYVTDYGRWVNNGDN